MPGPDPMPDMTARELDRWTETIGAVVAADTAAGIVDPAMVNAWRANTAVRDARRGRP
jgi:hypothetical protein